MIQSHHNQTIIAQCTPHGSGALALLRITGAQAVEVATAISKLASGKKLTELPSHTIHFGWVISSKQELIDQCMFLLMRGPKTFTGQDTIEISCHNNQFIIQKIIAQAIENGARLAQPGEFTQRAVLNNKIDIVQAEAINELIHANTGHALKKSLAQLEGSFSREIISIEKQLTKALAFSESSFEFIDETLEFGADIRTIIDTVLQSITDLKKNFDQQQHIRQGIRIAIIGSVNAGKSSLFNALLNKNRSIVTEIPGTTRDSIEAGLYKNNNYWTLIDTAGLRSTHDRIEQEGIERSFKEAQAADIILLVIDQSRETTQEEKNIYQSLLAMHHQKIIGIYNKIDMPRAENVFSLQNSLAVSSKEHIHIVQVEEEIENKIALLLDSAESPFLLNKRQFNLLLNIEKKLQEIRSMLDHEIHYELLSLHLQNALEYLSELTGKSISEQAMDAIFKEFCIGK